MFIDNIITEDGVMQEMDRICGSNKLTFPYKDKVARISYAAEMYFRIAFDTGTQWNFDDINKTSPPIDTQNLVSGTNRYKFSAFTEKILSVLRIEALTADAKGIELIPETFEDLGRDIGGNETGRLSSINADTFEELYVNAPAGTPSHYLKYGDFIYLRPNPNYNETDGLKVYFERALARLIFARFTVTVATPGVFSATAHGLVENDTVVLVTNGALPTGLSDSSTYYVISAGLTADAFQVSATLGGSAVNTTGTQSGVHTFLKTNQTLGIPEIHNQYIARQASMPHLVERKLPQKNDIAALIQQDVVDIGDFFSSRSKDIESKMIPFIENNK